MSTKTTTHLGRAVSWLDRQQIPPALVVAALVFLIAGGISGMSRLRLSPTVVAPTASLPAPIIIIASPLPQIPPTAAPIQVAAVGIANVTRRAIVVYGDHDLATAIGAVEAGRAYQVLARWGADWLRLDVSGSGVVYARTSDVLDIPADLVDLAPPPAPQVVYVSAPAAAYAAPTPAPEVTAPTLAPQQMVLLDRQQWAQQAQAARVAYPTLAPMEQNDVTQEWARQQYLSEHPEVSR